MEASIIVAVVGLIGTVLSALILKNQGQEKLEREDDRKRTALLIKATKASLNGLHQLGANGPVTECLHELDEYTNAKAAS